jgi:glycosyltransferase involved in cell wall biosynthesis
MACNRCVIGVPVGDVHELLDGVEGCYRTSRDANEIGACLAQALQANRDSNGRAILESRRLSLEGIAQRITAIYELALEQRTSDFQTRGVA